MQLEGKNVLITGAAVRVGRAMAKAVAEAGATLLIHYGSSDSEAKSLQSELNSGGHQSHLFQADLSKPREVSTLIKRAIQLGPLFALVNSAAIFEERNLDTTSLESWQRHLDINLTAPFLLSQAFWFANKATKSESRIVNILDWRALRPGADHLPYTTSKAALAALTQSLAAAMAPQITVNGIAFGAILPPSDGGDSSGLTKKIPAGRWATLEEVGETLVFLLTGPSYITGEIIYLDGGRHLI
ncbi:MAG: SDR family oxidoreductase [Chloroflexi bacterium]|nr:SDR family oxidoreductase [Chloroflexota bacterium]